MKLTSYIPSVAKKILVYGSPKTGKTDLVGQLAGIKKLWWFDLEDGVKTLLASPRMKPEWLENIELFRIVDTQIAPIAIQTLLRVIKGGEHKICHAHGATPCGACSKLGADAFTSINLGTFTNNDVLVIDSVTQLSASVSNYILRTEIAKDNYDFKMEWKDYMKQGYTLDRIFSILQQAPFNVVAISHEQVAEMEDSRKKLVPTAGSSNYSKTFAKYFDEIVYCEIVNKKHKAASSTTYSGSIVLGSRTNKVLELSDPPNLQELFKP